MKVTFEQTLLQSQLEIQEQTLRTISQEIHDNIGQILSLVSLNLNTMPTSDPGKLKFTDELVTKAITDLRSLSKSLNPERVQQVGLKEALEHELKQLEKTGMYATRLIVEQELEDISPEKTIILYRIIQEVINNIIKHAEADEVTATVSTDATYDIISIKDNGKGFDTNGDNRNGIGLQNIKNRAALISAEVVFLSEPDKGTDIIFKIKKNT